MMYFRNVVYNAVEKGLIEWCAHVQKERGQDISISSVTGTRLKIEINITDPDLENMDLNEYIIDIRPFDNERDFFLHDEEASGCEKVPKNLPEEQAGFSYTRREQMKKGNENV